MRRLLLSLLTSASGPSLLFPVLGLKGQFFFSLFLTEKLRITRYNRPFVYFFFLLEDLFIHLSLCMQVLLPP